MFIYIYRMAVLPEIQYHKIMHYISHPIADLMKPMFFLQTDLGVIIHVNDRAIWVRNTSNPSIIKYDTILVYEDLWKHT